jgi:hypothetical protein
MGLTANQMIELFEQQSTRTTSGLAAAVANSNYQLAAMNCRQGVKVRLMQGLVQWRSGQQPLSSLARAVAFHVEAFNAMRSIRNAMVSLVDTFVERVAFVAYLVGANWSAFDLGGFESDRLLDGVLANSLFDDFDQARWNRGMAELRKTGSSLAIETYDAYARLVRGPANERSKMMAKLTECFTERRKDEFFSGGDQTEGGGPDNDLTVDYRLGAFTKKLCITIDSIHSWKW